MKVMGIDPGLADVGYGIVERDDAGGARHLAHGVIQTSSKSPVPQRLAKIHRDLVEIIREHAPDQVAVEELFFAANMKTAIAVAQGRGAAILALAQSGVELAEYTPLQVKVALVGYGRASKMQVQQMVRAVLGLKEIPKPDHAADALAIALCHLHSMKSVRSRAEAQEEETRRRGDAEARGTEDSPEDGRREKNKSLLSQRRTRRR